MESFHPNQGHKSSGTKIVGFVGIHFSQVISLKAQLSSRAMPGILPPPILWTSGAAIHATKTLKEGCVKLSCIHVHPSELFPKFWKSSLTLWNARLSIRLIFNHKINNHWHFSRFPSPLLTSLRPLRPRLPFLGATGTATGSMISA